VRPSGRRPRDEHARKPAPVETGGEHDLGRRRRSGRLGAQPVRPRDAAAHRGRGERSRPPPRPRAAVLRPIHAGNDPPRRNNRATSPRGTASAEAWARIVADEARHVAYLAERAAYRRAIKAHKRDYRHQPARMHHEWERLCPAFAPGAQGQSGEAFARELAIERKNQIHERNRK